MIYPKFERSVKKGMDADSDSDANNLYLHLMPEEMDG